MSNGSIPYGRQHITEEDIRAVNEVLVSDFLTQGPKVKEFEDAFASYVGAKYAVAVCNATAGLHLCATVLGVKKGQKVISTPNSFVASSNGVLYCDGDIVFADIDPETYCLDPKKVEALLKKDPTAYAGIIPVDFAGHPARMAEFKELADRYGLWIVEDACHAPGATYHGEKCGSGKHADLSVFSFHPVKHIATGEGGMITTNDEELYRKLLLFRTHGITKDRARMSEYDGGWDMEMQELGFNFRISDILCALGLSQLNRADQGLARRQAIAKRYDQELSGLPIITPKVEAQSTHAYHLYVILSDQRKQLFEFLKTKNIHPQVHYIPIHQQPYYEKRYGKQSFPNAENFYQRCLSLPMYPTLSDEDQTRVIEGIKSFFG